MLVEGDRSHGPESAETGVTRRSSTAHIVAFAFASPPIRDIGHFPSIECLGRSRKEVSVRLVTTPEQTLLGRQRRCGGLPLPGLTANPRT